MADATLAQDALTRITTPAAWTVSGVAKKLGVSTETVRLWRLGSIKPSMRRRDQLFEVLGIPQTHWDLKRPS